LWPAASLTAKGGITVDHQISIVEVEGSPMEVFVFSPPGQGPHPGLILAQHIPVGHTGIENDTFTLKAAERFAAAGYVVAAPFIFHWWPKHEDIQTKRDGSRDDWMVADMTAAFELLQGREDVDGLRIGAVGHCWGGRVAWLAACHLPDLAACAVFYGGRIKLPMGEGARPPIELTDRIRCPVAGFFGDDDQNPSPADVDDYDAALTRAGVPHEFHRYPGAGHAFQNFPSAERYRPEQSEDAWSRVLEFLARTLATP
jgi:carboxymethylenebutenolidase